MPAARQGTLAAFVVRSLGIQFMHLCPAFARRLAACALIFAVAGVATASNQPPQIVSTPERVATSRLEFSYAVQAADPDGDTLHHSLVRAPAGATIEADTGLLRWRPSPDDVGTHDFIVRVEDDEAGRAEQAFELKVVEDFCPIYPIALPRARLDGAVPGTRIEEIERGTGPGNFSWLTWAGAVNAPTLAVSLQPPGDSDTYVDPDDATDIRIDIGDWAQGATGSMNAAAVRAAMDVLKTIDIILPVWDQVRGQGSRFDYRVQRFVIVRLLDYRLTGKGWLSFEFKGDASCYNRAPTALPQSLETDEDVPLPIELSGTDPEDDVLAFEIVEGPAHGVLSGTAPDLVYTPGTNYTGADAFLFRVDDGQLESEPAQVEILVRPVNDPPAAEPQQLTTPEDTPLPVTLSGSDPDGDAFEFVLISAPEHGTLSGTAPDLVYTPSPDFHGEDAFSFRTHDGELDSPPAIVAIHVTPLNDPPRAFDQSLETLQETPIDIVLVGSDPDADPLSFSVVDAPMHGALSGTPPELVYLPGDGFHGVDRFTFQVDDGELTSSPATVSITVIRRNDPPEIVSTPPPSVEEGAVYDYDVDAIDPNDDVLSYAIDREPSPSTIDGVSGRLRWPASDAFVGSLRSPNTMCRLPSGPGLFDPQTIWTWEGPNGQVQYSDVFGPVLVGQFTDDNGDGVVDSRDAPDLVAMSGPSQRYLNLIDGRTGANHWSVRLDALAQFGTPAIGDIDGDGGMEIVVEVGDRAQELRAFDADGSELWRTAVQSRSVLSGGSRDAIALADLEGDGDVEIIRGRTIVEHTGQVRCDGSFHSGGTSNYALVSAVADVDLDGIQEIVAGGTIYRPDCSRKAQLGSAADGYVAIGNFDEDDEAEIVLVANGAFNATGRLYVFNHDGSLKFGPVSFPNGGTLGPPTLANIDDDPFPEIGIAGKSRYAMFDHDGRQLWAATVQDESSNQTGSTSFDFEADGRAEIIYSDEKNLRVYDGRTGVERMRIANESGTTLEYPVVVDADGDGSADILVGSNGAGNGIRMISSATRSWAPTRSLWNQHTYHVDNVLDDGGIPRQPAPSWLGHNTYRLNTYPDRHAYGLADLALFDLRLDESAGTTIKLLVVNRGLAPTSAPTSVRVFNGRPDQGGDRLGTLPVPVLAAGESHTLTLDGFTPDAVDDDLHADIDVAEEILECADDNNFASAAYFVVRASDPEALFDTQRFTATVENLNQAPSILTPSLPDAQINAAYRFTVEASDPDHGDGLRFELDAAPAGMSIDPVSGELRWTPNGTQGGLHTVTVTVVDLGGLSAERSYELDVPVNRPPQIVTEPVTAGRVGDPYRYDVDAVDPDDDLLTYTLTNGPLGMLIDPDTGVISWTPTAPGAFPVRVEVNDGRGGAAEQSYVVDVSAPVNRPPQITTTPPPSVSEGATYGYDIDAIDPDADILDYRYSTALAGTTIEPASGQLDWPADAALVSGIRLPNVMCRLPSIATDTLPFTPVAKWTWSRRSALSMPLVGPLRDSNGDGHFDERDAPVVLINTALGFIDGASGTLVAVDGATGEELWENSTAGTRASATPAIGDLDGDGAPEIVAFVANGGVAAFDHAGRELWRTASTVTDNGYNYGSISLYDLEGDGLVEILHHGAVLNHDGSIRWRVQPQAWNRVPVYAIDVDGDGVQEVVVGPYMYSADGELLRTIPGGYGGWILTSPGNFDADPEPEFAVVLGNYSSSATEIRLLDTDWSLIWTRTDNTVSRGGPPVISDLDGNGVPDISFIGRQRHVAYTGAGELLWSNPITDSSTGTNGSTSFDFDGDGAHEVVSQDQNKVRVFDGRTGYLLFEADHSSPTAAESPIVADVDADGHADIVVEGRAANGASVAVYSDVENRWVATRSIWNQYSYHIDNVQNDGGIPRAPVKGWQTHNTFRLNALPDRHPLGQPDLALFDLRLDESDGTAVRVLVQNRGLAPSAATAVHVFNGPAGSGGVLLGTLEVPPLAAGEELTLSLDDLDPGAIDRSLFARIDDDNVVPECLEDNNATAAAYFAVRATDPGGLFDSQRFTVTVENVNAAPGILTTELPPAAVNQPYLYPVRATDPDLGDALRFELVDPPLGMMIEAVSGELRWSPASSQIGPHQITVRATDLGGLAAERSFEVQVSDNRPPQITSVPETSTPIGVEYLYDVEATDADGDALSFALMEAPGEMHIDGATGLVRWTPVEAGSVEIEIRVLDSRGSYAIQRYTLHVVAPPNSPPQITSSPSTTATPARLYTYLVDAIDPDGDALSVLLPVKPTGMTLNESTGQVSWVPTAAQVGLHAVRVQVIDGRGGEATQDFQIQVQAAGVNTPPTILSTPPFTAKVGKEYRYALQAEDPDGDALIYSLTQAPAGMGIDASGLILWTPATQGNATIKARVADAQSWIEQTWTVSVLSAETALDTIVQVTPDPAEPGQPITVFIAVTGAAAEPTVTATLDGVPLPLDPDGTTTFDAPDSPGEHVLIVTVDDGHDTDTTTRTIHIVDPSDTSAPTATIHAPREGGDEEILVLTAPSEVVISVADDNLQSWRLLLMERNVQAGAPIELAAGSGSVSEQAVATIDPTLLVNGQYALVLNASDASGQTAQDIVNVSVEGDMKLGHFSIAFEDINLPVAGLPVSVTRTYDTRRRHQALDFGQGWSLAYQNVRLYESRRPGFAWEFTVTATGPLGLIPRYCMESALGNVVSVTLADGRVEKFRARAFPECNDVLPLVDVEIRFEPMPGTHGRLEVLGEASGRLVNGSIVDITDPGSPLDPDDYRYIDAEGVEYTLDQSFGLRQIQERTNDNTITFGPDGIVHSNGTSLDFVRDAAGRITTVIAPDGSERHYEYDAQGNLAAYVDAGGGRTEFTYQSGHYLRDIIDPRGVRVARNEYDDDGRLVAVIDADGNRIEYTHDIDGRVERVKDRNGGTTTYVYNDRGDILAETDPLSHTTHRSYDINGNELSRTDPLDRTQQWTYDPLGNVLSETNGAGETTTYTFGKFNHPIEQRDAAGRLVYRNFWRNITLPGTGIEVYPGPLTTVTDGNGAVTGFGYDDITGELNRVTDASGASSRFELDPLGFKIADIDAMGRRTEYVNDLMGRVVEARRTRTGASGQPEVLVTRYTYDDAGNLVATEHPDGGVTRSEFDPSGLVLAEIDALGRRTEFGYNDRGERILVRHPDGTEETTGYDANGNIVVQTDRRGRTTQMVYDAANRLVETLHPDDTPADDADNPRSVNVYDAAGQLVQSIDEEGRATSYDYDAAGRRIATTLAAIDGLTASVTDEYDTSGRRVASTDADGNRTEYRYDTVGRLVETIHPDDTPATLDDNPRTRFELDPVGRKLAETDELGRTTRYAHDPLGRLVAVVLPDPATGLNPPLVGGASPEPGTLTTRYVYDEVGNKIEQIDAEGRVTRWEYDAMGRETARILPEGERETKQYNLAGELVAHTDFDGRTTRYVYDDAGRLRTTDYPRDADVGFDYDAAGARIAATDGRGTSTTEYDARGRVLRSVDADGGQIEYTYDASGNLLARISPSQSLVYAYDARNRLIEVVRTVDGEAPMTTRYEYDANGNRSAMLGGDGIRTEYSYDRRHRLRQLVKKAAAGAVILAMNYTVDASGMRTAVEEADTQGAVRAVAYTYDAVKRLTRETIDHRDDARDRDTSWSYDRVGNRLVQTLAADGTTETTAYAYDTNDRLLSETRTGGTTSGTTTYAYDANGNTREKSAPGEVTTYAYDDANRLVEAVTPQGRTAYVYSADGLRVRQIHTPAGGTPTTTWYVQDTAYAYAQVIEQYNSQGTGPKSLAATFTFADDLVAQTRYDTGSPVTRFVHADGFGSTRWLTDANGMITDSIDYDAFGLEIEREGSTAVEHLYRGERFDANVAAYDLRARLYTPGNGRFLTQDSFAGFSMDPQSLHKYGFNHNDPVNRVDPSGHVSLIEMMISTDIQGVLRTGSTAVGRRAFKRILFGHPPQDVGVVGEMVLDWVLQGFMDHIQDGGITKQEFGQRVHRDLKNKCAAFRPIGNVRLVCEPFYDDAGNEYGHSKKGTLGVDIMIYDGNRRVIAIELKTGKGMNDKGFKGRRKYSGTSVIQITLKGDRD
jgi:RHS repeat-associated protein